VRSSLTLFISLFTTMLAIINPLEAVPVFLNLLQGKDEEVHRRVARKSCHYALGLMFFFLLFGTLLLRLFGVPLSMVRVVGGIILIRIGFDLFGASSSSKLVPTGASASATGDDVAFIPMAMPIMFGPGGIATIISVAATAHLGHGHGADFQRDCGVSPLVWNDDGPDHRHLSGAVTTSREQPPCQCPSPVQGLLARPRRIGGVAMPNGDENSVGEDILVF